MLTSSPMGLLTGPHLSSHMSARYLSKRRGYDSHSRETYQMSFSELGSLTILLSDGDRPVFVPEYAVNAPDEEMAVPISYT